MAGGLKGLHTGVMLHRGSDPWVTGLLGGVVGRQHPDRTSSPTELIKGPSLSALTHMDQQYACMCVRVSCPAGPVPLSSFCFMLSGYMQCAKWFPHFHTEGSCPVLPDTGTETIKTDAESL